MGIYVFGISLFWIVYGILTLVGIAPISKQYQGYSWSQQYRRSCGISWLLLGGPLMALYLVSRFIPGPSWSWIIWTLLAVIPGLSYAIRMYQKFQTLRSSSQNGHPSLGRKKP